MGDILLSETDTLKNAFRVYKLRSYSVAMDIDLSKLDSARLKQVIEEKYEWYAKGYDKPVFETITSTSYAELSPLGTTQYAYCYLPEYPMCDARCQQPEEIYECRDKEGQGQFRDIIHYKVDVNGYRVNIDYSLDAKSNVTMLIASQMGMVYYSKRYAQGAGTGYQASFDIGGLRPGVYVLYINVDGKTYHEKIQR